jgi:hypothetical protein
LLAAVCETVTGTVGTAELIRLAGSGAICDAQMAAKLRELGAAELLPPKKFGGAAEPTLFGIADSIVEVTVKVKANVKARSTWMHLVDQPCKTERARRGERKGSGMKRIRFLPMEEGEMVEGEC